MLAQGRANASETSVGAALGTGSTTIRRPERAQQNSVFQAALVLPFQGEPSLLLLPRAALTLVLLALADQPSVGARLG